MMPPKMVPSALVSLGIRMTRMAGCTGPVPPSGWGVLMAMSRFLSSSGLMVSYVLPSTADRQTMPETALVPAQPLPLGAVNDAVLARLVAERRPEALSELYDRHAPSLLALARRILGTVPDAEDVVQEVFVHLWNHVAR